MSRRVLSFVLGGLVFGGSSVALAGDWVHNGSTVTYVGTNELRIGYGTVNIGGTDLQVSGADVYPFSPSGIIWAEQSGNAICPTSSQQEDVDDDVFYVYAWDSSGTIKLVVSPVQPYEDGYASSNLQLNNGSGCQTGLSSGNFAFLGSFITDDVGGIVPFERSGEQVIFSGGLSVQTNIFTSSGSSEWDANFHAAGYPASASAILVDIQAYSTDTSHDHTLYFVDPNFSVPAGCSTGTQPTNYLSALDLFSGTLGAGATAGARVVAVTPSTEYGSYYLAVCDSSFTSGKKVSVNVSWMGYIEPVHHMNQNRY